MTRFFGSRLLSIAAFAAAMVLSSCVGAVVQSSFLPHDSGAASASIERSVPRVLYAQSNAGCCYFETNYTPIPGMTLTLPAATTWLHHALVTFNAPTEGDVDGACFFAVVANSATVATAQTGPTSYNNIYNTMNIVVQVPLTSSTQTVAVEEENYCNLLDFYSVTAQLTN